MLTALGFFAHGLMGGWWVAIGGHEIAVRPLLPRGLYLAAVATGGWYIIRQNITGSLAVKGLFVLLTFLGQASLWAAIAADTGVSLLVVFNALRLLGPGADRTDRA